MKISELLKPWTEVITSDCDIIGLHNDSRQIHPGFLFFAYPGALTDGRLYIRQAIAAGALAALYEPDNWPENCAFPDNDIIMVPIRGLAQNLAAIASRFYDEPTKKIGVIGVTGTNGKTTIAWQLAQAHELLSTKAAYIGTLGHGRVTGLASQANTTPDALCLQHLFHNYQKEGIKQVCMEVSSHALAMQRVDNIDFQQAIFTNLTLDHLDFHQNMDAYAAAKSLLFACVSLQWAIVNFDDSHAQYMIAAMSKPCKLITYGIGEGSDVRALKWDVTMQGTVIDVESPWGRHQLTIKALGFFNIYNALAVFSSLLAGGYDTEKVLAVMPLLHGAPGRMEVVTQQPCTIVDYAHTPDALENVLLTLNKVKKGRILLVFGCGGDRDKSKRPIMGSIASCHADVIIITSDNPRTEEPLQIMNDIRQGLLATDTDIHMIADRKKAIEKAVSLARQDDIILVAGKGHEAYQEIGRERFSFSDQAVIKGLVLR